MTLAKTLSNNDNSDRFNIHWTLIIIVLAVIFRLAVMTLGNNFDFESYLIVGKIVSQGGNVYAETARYNYGFPFSLIQGLLYKLSTFFADSREAFRVLIVMTLTLFDIALGLIILKKYNIKLMALFLLNPVSVIITGYHNQFDNIAVFLAFSGVLLINDGDEFTVKDIAAILLISLSLMVKHILFIFPFWLVVKSDFHIKKKLIYASIPVLIFLMSFVPFWGLGSQGIIDNVFSYRSFNNFPLLHIVLSEWDLSEMYKPIFFILMIVLGIIVRRKSFEEIILFYLLGVVCFSSAIANQYLAIPILALCVVGGRLAYLYFAVVFVFLCFHRDAFKAYPEFIDKEFIHLVLNNGYIWAVWILFFTLVYNIFINSKLNTK